jgi:hypothetical protein
VRFTLVLPVTLLKLHDHYFLLVSIQG